MRRRHFLKALAVVSAAVSLAPKLAVAATLEEATRPYVIQSPVLPVANISGQLAEYGQYVKVSDLLFMPTAFPSNDPLVQYGVQGWKIAYVSKIVEPQHRAAVLANLARG
jgi:hypothetical protein